MGFLIDKEKWTSTPNYVDSYYRDFSNANQELEYEADIFALSFLIPSDEFYRIVKQNTNESNMANLESIARYFKASTDLIEKRGRFLGIF